MTITSDTGGLFGRREFLRGVAGLGLALALVGPARADAVSTAQQLVVSLSAELTRMVNSGQSAAQMDQSFGRIVGGYADMTAVSASILGLPWRSATAAQKSGFVSAFQTYFASKYGQTFNQYKNASIAVTGAKDAGKAGVLVNSAVKRPGQQDIRVDWQISDRSGSAKVVNLIIEGVSMLANERAEIGAMLDAQGGSLDKLIAQMKRA